MGKNKPRHNPDKPQNKYGKTCKCYIHDGGYYCPACHKNMEEIKEMCGLNPHNCTKIKYKLLASLKDSKKELINVHCFNYFLNKW